MIATIHLDLHREAVRLRVWTEADRLVMVSLGQNLGEVVLRLRPDSATALALALAIARALRLPTDTGRGGPGAGSPPVSHPFDAPPARRPGHGKKVRP